MLHRWGGIDISSGVSELNIIIMFALFGRLWLVDTYTSALCVVKHSNKISVQLGGDWGMERGRRYKLIKMTFAEPEIAICGNGVVEEGEECDCGWEEVSCDWLQRVT